MAVDKFRAPKPLVLALCALSALLGLFFVYDHWVYQKRTGGGSWVFKVLPAPAQYLDNVISDNATFFIGGIEPDKRISIAAIDDDTLGRLGFPFQRRYHARLIDRLSALGAKVIVFDVMFLEADKLNPEDDRQLLQSVGKAGNVALAGLMEKTATMQGEGMDAVTGETVRFRFPFGGLREAALLCAFPNTEAFVDRDGHLRRMMIFDNRAGYSAAPGSGYGYWQGKPIASLAAGAYSALTGTKLEDVQSLFPENIYRLNLAQVMLRKKSPGRPGAAEDAKQVKSLYPQISIVDILDGALSDGEKALIKDGAVFVASTSMGAYDHYSGPYGDKVPGVMFHANLLDNMLNKNWMRPAPAYVSFAAMIALLWASLVAFNLPLIWGAVFTVALAALWAVIYAVVFMGGGLLAMVMPETGIAAGFAAVTFYRVVVEGKEKRWIKGTFGQYLSPKVVEIIIKDPARLKLGGEKREMTIFFLDIAHFTSISEKMDPEALPVFLNRYLSAFTDIILENDGVVDKYIGDCIMAFWNAPLDLPQHQYYGCLSAVQCIKAIEELNKNLPPGLPETPAIRIGLNSGFVKVGNFGSSTRFSYTVIGDEVNLASRLEGANKFFSSRILVSEATYLPAKDRIVARELGRVRVVGKNAPIRVYEPLATAKEQTPDIVSLAEACNLGAEKFAAGNFGAAAKSYLDALAIAPHDAAAKRQMERALDYKKSGPPPDWDGVFNLTSK
ncbi:MAG: adenylate/guanylate cyclase domain-containing protein [Elusimicrobiales bacterium]